MSDTRPTWWKIKRERERERDMSEGKRRKAEKSSSQATQKANPVVLAISSLNLWTLAYLNGK